MALTTSTDTMIIAGVFVSPVARTPLLPTCGMTISGNPRYQIIMYCRTYSSTWPSAPMARNRGSIVVRPMVTMPSATVTPSAIASTASRRVDRHHDGERESHGRELLGSQAADEVGVDDVQAHHRRHGDEHGERKPHERRRYRTFCESCLLLHSRGPSPSSSSSAPALSAMRCSISSAILSSAAENPRII